MKVTISEEIFEKFPDVSIGVVVARGVKNGSDNPGIMKMISEIQGEVAEKFEGKPIAENPTIKAWRRVYKDFGAEKYRSSVEAMVKRTTRGDKLGSINSLVDLYNFISLKYILPLGGEDLDNVEGDIVLAVAEGTERFIPLFSTEIEHPKIGEVVYKDGKDVMCRRWNWREADKTKLTEETTNAIFVTEGVLLEEKKRVKEATKELGDLITSHCNGKCRHFFLDKKLSEIALDSD